MRASDQAYATLLEEIQSGALAPGTVLAETEQAARLGVSRTPAREAIGRLVATGLAAQQSPRVTVVTGFDASDIRALFDVRRALEESAARIAARRGDPTVFAALADDFAGAHPAGASARSATVPGNARADEGAADAAVDAYYALIARFDAALDNALDNAYFAQSLRTVRTHLARARGLARGNPDRLLASVAEHRLIAEAIAAGDAELAAHATHVHLHNALSAILSSLATPEESEEGTS